MATPDHSSRSRTLERFTLMAITLGVPGPSYVALWASGYYPVGLAYAVAVLVVAVIVTRHFVRAERRGFRRWAWRASVIYGIGLPISLAVVTFYHLKLGLVWDGTVDYFFKSGPARALLGATVGVSLLFAVAAVPLGRRLRIREKASREGGEQ